MTHKVFEQAPELTRVSSKGQLVIPTDIRKQLRIHEGDVFAAASFDHNLMILKKIKNPLLKKDIAIVKDVEKAWEEIESGKCKTMEKGAFLKEFKKW